MQINRRRAKYSMVGQLAQPANWIVTYRECSMAPSPLGTHASLASFEALLHRRNGQMLVHSGLCLEYGQQKNGDKSASRAEADFGQVFKISNATATASGSA